MFRFVSRLLAQRPASRQAASLRVLRLTNNILVRPFSFLTRTTFKSWIWALLGTQVFYFGVLVFIYLGLLGASEFLRFRSSPVIQDNWTWIIGHFNQVCTWLLISNTPWVLLVFCNHFNDMSTIFMQVQDTTFMGLVGAFAAFWDITVWSMANEFIQTLWSNPSGLGNTKAVCEIILAWSNFSFVMCYTYSMILQFVWTLSPFLSGSIQNSVGAIGEGSSVVLTYISSSAFAAFGYVVSTIHHLITPEVPGIFQGSVDSVFRPLASTIAVSILLWVLRYFLGFPF